MNLYKKMILATLSIFFLMINNIKVFAKEIETIIFDNDSPQTVELRLFDKLENVVFVDAANNKYDENSENITKIIGDEYDTYIIKDAAAGAWKLSCASADDELEYAIVNTNTVANDIEINPNIEYGDNKYMIKVNVKSNTYADCVCQLFKSDNTLIDESSQKTNEDFMINLDDAELENESNLKMIVTAKNDVSSVKDSVDIDLNNPVTNEKKRMSNTIDLNKHLIDIDWNNLLDDDIDHIELLVTDDKNNVLSSNTFDLEHTSMTVVYPIDTISLNVSLKLVKTNEEDESIDEIINIDANKLNLDKKDLKNNNLIIKYNADNEGTLIINMNGDETDKTISGKGDELIHLMDGENNIQVELIENGITFKLNDVIDCSATTPIVNFNHELDGITVNDSTIIVSGTVTNTDTLMLNDNAIEINDDKFEISVNLVDGNNILKFAAIKGDDTTDYIYNVNCNLKKPDNNDHKLNKITKIILACCCLGAIAESAFVIYKFKHKIN